MTEKHILKFYETLIKIFEEKFNVTITYSIKKI